MKKMKPFVCVMGRRLRSRVLLLAVFAFIGAGAVSHAQFVPQFSSPATNSVEDASWQGDFLYPDGAYTSVAVEILRGAHIVPTSNVSTAISASFPSNTVTVTMDPIAGVSGSVQAQIQGYIGSNLQTSTVFNVVFLPLPPPVELTLDFTSPAATALPGAPFSGDVIFAPGNTSVWFDAEIISGASVVPLTNIVLTRTASNVLNVVMQPLTNRSGLVEIELTGEDMLTSDTVPFSVFFKTYPPVIAPIAPVTMNEDTTNTVTVTVSDVDTAIQDVTLAVSMQATTNPNLFSSPTGVLQMSGSGTNRTLTIRPADDMNGVATIRITAEDDDDNIVHRDFQLTVTPVPDRSVILGATHQFFGDDVLITNIFSGVTIIDVDHEMPNPETLNLVVSLANDQIATFQSGGTTFTTSGSPAQVTSAIQSVGVTPIRFRGLPGMINEVEATISVTGVEDGLVTNRSINVEIEVINTPPEFIFFLSPDEIAEDQTRQPFFISYILDPDQGDEIFELNIELVNPADHSLVNISPATQFTDNESGLKAAVRGLNVTVNSGLLTNDTQEVPIRFSLTDGYGGTTSETNILLALQAQTPPSIFGIPFSTATLTDASDPIIAFPTVSVQDPDEGGQQLVEAVIFQSNTNIGFFSETVFPLQTPQSLSTALRLVTYTPIPGALPVGAQADSVFTLQVTDRTGLSAQDDNRRVRITSVNTAPQILNIPSIQPILIPPVAPIQPFAGLEVTNDDPDNVLFTITIDNPDKGSLSNLGDFTQVNASTYQLSGSIATIMGSLPTIEYTLNPAFLFPGDDPGGTTFTLSARDSALLTTTRSLYIQIQDEPRNHLVTRVTNDGNPGSFNYVLSQVGNNDVITFALPSYPATIRLPGTLSTLINRNLTIKGPGANLLKISGDNNGDGQPNRQLFRIAARVTIEGVTLSHGTAGFGGAVLVESAGNLTLRNVAVVDSVAAQYGGAIDVDGGKLTLDGCFIGRNQAGISGGGISAWTDQDLNIVNTTFAQNQQINESGDGGGAVAFQNRTQSTTVNARITHSTFAENVDASGTASAVLGIDFGARVWPWNSIFADESSRNLQVASSAEFRSQGGNVCDDSTATSLSQQGQSESIFLLDHATDLTSTLPLLAPLNLTGDPTPFYPLLSGSPAINRSSASVNRLDQLGILRSGVPDSGASEFDALQRVLISEIRFDNDAGVNFIELFVRRDSTPVNLAPYALFVNGQRVHDFADSASLRADTIFSLGQPVSPIIEPGFGMVVAFADSGPLSLVSPMNPTPVVGLSVAGATTDLPARGQMSVGLGGAFEPIIQLTYNGTYLDPVTGTNVLATALNSIALAPQFRGFALVPHSWIDQTGPFAGVDPSQNLSGNTSSPGGDASGTPFGQDNAEPLALPDLFTVGEDDISLLDVLANDFDSDGNDRLVIVDVSTASNPGSGDNQSALSALGATITIEPSASPLRGEYIVYDPRNAPLLQQLPSGVEIIDTFYYEIIDIGSAPVAGYEEAGPNTLIHSINHRLTNNAVVIISGATSANYNGTHVITVVDDDSFTIPVLFAGNVAPRGIWETAEPRSPSSRSEASVSVRVIGANDPPVAVLDVITNVTERSTVRIMARPERAGDPTLTFSADPVPPPDLSTQDLLSNDFDVDTDDSWETLQIVGVLGSLNEITGYSGVPGDVPVTVHSPAHGLQPGTEILIANYGGHSSYNGYFNISVVDEDSFTIPVFYVDNHPDAGVWVILNEANRYQAVTDVGATVTMTLRADPTLDNVVYDANSSSFLRGLAEDELYTNRFWYAITDSHGAVGIGPIDVIVSGVNDPPEPRPDPDSLYLLDPIVDDDTPLAEVLETGLDLMYLLPPTSGGADRIDLHVLDNSGTLSGTLVLRDFFVTDEDTPLDLSVADLLANDEDVDRMDVLDIIEVDPFSRQLASVTLSGGVITFDPTVSSHLQALAREEMLIDTFEVVVSDGMTGGSVTSLVAVLVIGVNDTPIANDLSTLLIPGSEFVTNEDEMWSIDLARMQEMHYAFDVDTNNIIPDDRLRFIPQSDVPNPGLAAITVGDGVIHHDSTVSALLNALSITQIFTNSFEYTVIDNSFLFAVDDHFYIPAGASGRVLDVLANDRDFTDSEGILTIIDAGPTLEGGLVEIAPDGLSLIYSAPPGFVGEDYFRYTIQNDKGDVNSGRVMVRSVVPPLNGVLHAADNVFAMAAGETVMLDVTANDNQLPATGAGLTIIQVFPPASGPQPILTNNMIQLTANTATTVSFGYEVSAGGTARAIAQVTVLVVERRGSLRVQDNYFSALPGIVEQELDVLSNDGLITESVAHLRIQSVFDGDAVGSIAISPDSRKLIYSPPPNYIGTEQIRYVATDQIGGTGTATVHIAVGEARAVPNFYKLEATNASPVSLDVLNNNRTLPAAASTTLTITSVDPAASAIGTLAVSGGGAYLTFAANGVQGQQEFTYLMEDASTPPRVAEGRVRIETVGPGTYANPNTFHVRSGGSGYMLNVLTNDVGYPSGNREYSILSIGAGADGPSAGGSVTISGNQLVYTPAPGFVGEERFKYTMSDSVSTDVAEVTVLVRRGNLAANDDVFSVFYEIPAGTNVARSFNLPVTLNDRIQPPLGQTLQVWAIGEGTNAPNQGGSVQIAPDQLSLIYRPGAEPTPEYVERFTYEITDGAGRFASAEVRVRVRNRQNNLVALTHDDYFTVARNSSNNTLNVLANDFVRPGSAAGWTITNVSPSSVSGGSVAIVGNAVRYTPPAKFVGVDEFSYTVNDGLGGTGAATVYVRVGSLPTLPSLFTVLSDAVEEELDVLANDVLTLDYEDEYTLFQVYGATEGGVVTLSGSNTILYTPDAGHGGPYPYTETFFYLIDDDTGGTATGRVDVIVHEAGSDRSTGTITLLVEGRDDPPIINPDPDSLSKLEPIVDATGSTLADILASGLDLLYTLPPSSGGQGLIDLHVLDLSGTVPEVIDLHDFFVTDEDTPYQWSTDIFLANDIEFDQGDVLEVIEVDAQSRLGAVLTPDVDLASVVTNVLYDPSGTPDLQALARDEWVVDTFNIIVRESRPDFSFSTYTSVVAILVVGVNDTPTASPLHYVSTEDDVWSISLQQMIDEPYVEEIDINSVVPDDRFVLLVDGSVPNPGQAAVMISQTNIVHDATVSSLLDQLAEWQSFTNVFEYTVTDNSFLFAVNDAFHVEPGESRSLPLLANDRDWTDSDGLLTIIDAGPTFLGASVTISADGQSVDYTAPADGFGADYFRYIITNDTGDIRAGRVTIFSDPGAIEDEFVVLSSHVDVSLDVLFNDSLPGGYSLSAVHAPSAGGSASIIGGEILYTPATATEYPYVEMFSYEAHDGSGPVYTGMVRVAVHEVGSDRATSTVTIHVLGLNDPPVILNPAPNPPITDKQTATPFAEVTIIEIDEQMNEVVDVLVEIDDADKGVFTNLGSFEYLGGGQYALTNVNGAAATLAIRALVFEPTENRIPVPETETAYFTITVTDNRSPPVVDTQTAIDVTAVNDPPIITGTRSNQQMYEQLNLAVFSTVTIEEVDDLGLQPLTVRVQILPSYNGELLNIGDFEQLSDKVYVATNITAAEATQQLRNMLFSYLRGNAITDYTVFRLVVDDGFADPVEDMNTSVTAYTSYEAAVTTSTNLLADARSFGAAVAISPDYAVVGAPSMTGSSPASGVAYVYKYVTGTSNTWEELLLLQPSFHSTNDHFGSSAAISGHTIAVGAMSNKVDGISVGAVYIFTKDEGGTDNWGEVHRIAPTNMTPGSMFGRSVALDGDYLVVGAPHFDDLGNGDQAGGVFIYLRDEGGPNAWGEVARLSPQGDGRTNALFGTSVGLRNGTLVVGAPAYDADILSSDRDGVVFHYHEDAGNWGLIGMLESPVGGTAEFGRSLDLYQDQLVVGAPNADGGRGQAFIYSQPTSADPYNLVAQKVPPETLTGLIRYGVAVGIDRDVVLVGAPGFLAGRTMVYQLDPVVTNQWGLREVLIPPPIVGDSANAPLYRFGSAIGFHRGAAIIGAPVVASSPGYAFMYRFTYNSPPVIVATIGDQFAQVGNPFTLALPSDLFIDPLGYDVSMHVQFLDGDNGLAFDGVEISGVPLSVGLYRVLVVGTDPFGQETILAFNIVVTGDSQLSDTPRNRWDLARFGNDRFDPLLEETLWGGSANPDQDDWNNDQEYAFGGNPNMLDANPLSIGPGSIADTLLTYTRRTNDPDLLFVLEGTIDFSSWFVVDQRIVAQVRQYLGDDVERVTLHVEFDETEPMLHYRIRVIWE